jgi:hypothetical protein
MRPPSGRLGRPRGRNLLPRTPSLLVWRLAPLFRKNGTVTENSTPPPPVEYAVHSDSPRPTAVTVLAIIGLVLGGLLVLCKPLGAAVQLLMPMPQPNAVMNLMRNDPAIRGFTIGSTITGTLLSLLLLMSSIGSLGLRQWARTGMLAYAFLAVVMSLVNQAVGVFVIGPEVERAIQQSGMPTPPGMKMMGGWVGVAVGLALGLWYPLLIIVYYTRPRVKEAFERGLPKRSGI